MQFAIAARLNLPNPEAGAVFLKDALGFQVEYRLGYGWWVENGSIVLILQEGIDSSPYSKQVTIPPC